MHTATHSVMFHHFHGGMHLPAQGSLSYSDFQEMIAWLRSRYSLLDASDYKIKLENNSLVESDICLSFDDGLKCQYDVASPVLYKLGINAFFFIYSSVFTKNPDPLEMYRYFRTSCFRDIDEFYSLFFQLLPWKDAQESQNYYAKYRRLNYLSAFPFYTANDKYFRYLRDQCLSQDQYHEIMHSLMLEKEFDVNAAKQNLWMSEKDLVDLESQGHIVGLHSHSHPTQMSKLSKAEQRCEYHKNYDHLTKLLGGKPIKAMSHPCGDYNEDTLSILSEMGIEIGFRSSMSVKNIRSPLEIPREDHTNVLMEMK